MYLAFNNDSTISFNININNNKLLFYSYYCVINKKIFLLLFGIRNKNTMKAELIFDD